MSSKLYAFAISDVCNFNKKGIIVTNVVLN